MILSIIYLRLHHLKLFSGIFLSLIGIIGLLILASLVKIPLVSLLPFISGYNFTHIMENMGFFICIIGGILIQVIISNLTNNDKTKLLYSRAISSSVIFFIFGIVILTNINKKIEHAYAWVSWGNLYQNTKNPIFKNLRQQISKNEQPSRVMSFHMHGTLLTAYGLETIAGYHPLTSELYSKLWFKMAEKWTQRPYWEDSFGKLTNFTFEAITSIFPATKNGLGLTRTHQKGEWILSDFANITLLSLMNAEFIVSKNKLLDQNLFELNTSPKSWDTLSQTEKIKTNLKANFTGEKPYYLYQNPNVLPRAFSVNTVKIFDTKEDILDALGTTDLKTLQKTVFIEKNHGLSELKKNMSLHKLNVNIERYKSNIIEIKIDKVDASSFLILTNSYSPFWKCFVDGVETKIIPANYAFWGVLVPPLTSQIIFRYSPPYSLDVLLNYW